MIPIPSSKKSLVEGIPPEIACHILSYLPSRSRGEGPGPDKYASVVSVWREIRGFVRSERFRSITISGMNETNSKLPFKFKLLIDILVDIPSIANCVRHITVECGNPGQTIDPYPHLPRLLNLCRNIQSAKFESAQCLGLTAAYDLIATAALTNNPNLDATNIPRLTMSKLHLAKFKGTVSDLYNFLVKFPALTDLKLTSCKFTDLTDLKLTSCKFTDLETFLGRSVLPPDIIDFDNPPASDGAPNPVPVGFRPLTNISVLHFEGEVNAVFPQRWESAFMDLLGSSQTLFPNVERLYYRFDELVREQRLVNRLKASLKALELAPMQFTSRLNSQMLVLPPQLEYFGFKVSVSSRDLSAEGLHVRTLNQVSQSDRTLKRVKIGLRDIDDLVHGIPAIFAQVGGLDDILVSDELGVEKLDLVIQITSAWTDLSTGSYTELNWKILLQQMFPKVIQRFYGKSSRAKGYEGTLHWDYGNARFTVLDDQLLVWGDDNT